MHLNLVMPISLPTSVLYIQYRINSPLYFAYFGDFQYYKGRICKLHDSRELIGCCRSTNDAGREVGMVQDPPMPTLAF